MGTGQMALGWKGDFSLYIFLYFLIFESYERVTDPKTKLFKKNKSRSRLYNYVQSISILWKDNFLGLT